MPASQTAETAPPARRGGDPGFGLYVHWPFCKAKCPYCDFNSHVRDAVPQDRWRAALLAELAAMAARTPHRRLDSIFFGGGTPSLMPPETAAAVIAAARRHWPVADDLEITLEANPTSVEAGRFRALADEAGVNRLSLGVQSLDPDALRFLGRGHSADEARAAIALARRHFPRVSFDLIYALPGQSLEAWRAQLTEALARAGGHLSLYQLTIEPGTGFAGAVRRGDWAPLDGEAGADQFELTQELCAAAGLPAYEISNHAAPGAECRHNVIYWAGGDWAGIGPGAHGRLTLADGRHALARYRGPDTWLARIEATGDAGEEDRLLPPREVAEELLMMGLRWRDGLDRARFAALTGHDPLDWPGLGAAIADLAGEDLLQCDARRLRATPRGQRLLNPLLERLLAALDD